MKNKLSVFLILIVLAAVGCEEENVMPKPKAMLRLDYPIAKEALLDADHFSFNYNDRATPIIKNQSAIIIDYPSMKGSIFVTHKNIDGNLQKLIADAEKLSMEHMKKADNIQPRTFINEENRVYGTYFQIIGDAASQSQFYLTDSVQNFITGSVYFYSKPNYDSILPAADYLQGDMRAIMETLRWKK
ncbi:gliding motility lipoprotein GldD [Cellulophaga sp. E16_2]|uniref:Protein involved in gliding motility GldD n=1 Tax=Cellulophaga algicola (strain DSM 14237 / IC166 / ACAM 630) TaxID=688270 RepID=E6X5P8_CELAD|nr:MULTISPECIES: gliding motility lipoprotein GldD [Cellulophaga]ADV48414.1 protein involved in gliding motility GldD [Cellulophaga algicola DSM 14237]MBO0590829.1 gliding motility lipoprotein GldD [Cellulophaga sp. E16_2]